MKEKSVPRQFNAAIFLIAASALSTGSMAQNVYKCGATYSQIPCEGSVSLNVADRRSKEQQLQSGTVATKDAKSAAALEEARRQNEKQTAASNPSASKKVPPNSKVPEKKQNSVPTTAILSPGLRNQDTRKKTKEPEFFTATVASDKKKKKGESQP